MKTIVKTFAALTILILSCDDNDQPKSTIHGTYTGHFQRSSPEADWMVANVTLVFGHNTFSGESDQGRYPAICDGTYEIAGDTIKFNNDCVWTADFDWTFILYGEFEFETTGDQLTLTRRYSEHVFDQYTLTRQ
jgi:hypothetical protein